MKNILEEIVKERSAQENKWGEQNHSPMEWLPILMEEVGEVSKEALDHYFKNKNEECAHPTAIDQELRMVRYRKELVQVAAVAVQMIECLDRNETPKIKNHAN